MAGPAPHHADRPAMPGYGVLAADQGSGLIPWTEARRRLSAAHDYWLATVRPDGAPHVMPVWGVWLDARVWFSRTALAQGTQPGGGPPLHAHHGRRPRPGGRGGVAERRIDADAIAAFVAAVNAKYDAALTPEFQDPAVNGTFAVRPVRVFAISGDDFAGSATRWTLARE